MKKKIMNVLIYVLLLLIVIVAVAPLVIVLSSSFRTITNMTSPLKLFIEFSLESYIRAFTKMNYLNGFMNSVLTTFGSVIVIVLIASMAAYPLARVKKKSSSYLYYLFISGLVIPAQMTIVPIAQMFGRLGIPNTRFTPMVMFVTCSLPFSVFLYTGFVKGVPAEVEEAAYMEGAGLWRRYITVVFPLIKPATTAVLITQGMWIWNDYFFPMVFVTKSNQYSLPVSMLQFLGDKENPAQWNVLFAACVLCVLPLCVLFACVQKQFINGIAAGAVKG